MPETFSFFLDNLRCTDGYSLYASFVHNIPKPAPKTIIRKTICPKSQNDLSEDWGDTTAFFGRVVFGWFVYP